MILLILEVLKHNISSMKTIHKLSFLVALTCLISLSSCSNNDDKDPVKSDAELIGSGIAWKLSKVTASGIDVVSLFDDCQLDNLVTFNYKTSVSTGVQDAGATKCDESEEQKVDFTWSYNESTKVLSVDTEIIEIPGGEGNFSVESVTANELVFSRNVSFSGITQKAIITLIH